MRFCENAATFFVDFTKLWIAAPSGSAPFLLIETRSCAVLELAVSPAAASSINFFTFAIVLSPVPAHRRVKMVMLQKNL